MDHTAFTLQTHHICLHLVSVHQTAPPLTVIATIWLQVTAHLSTQEDERLSWPSYLTYSGRFTHIMVTHQLQVRESSPVRARRSTTDYTATFLPQLSDVTTNAILQKATLLSLPTHPTSARYCTPVTTRLRHSTPLPKPSLRHSTPLPKPSLHTKNYCSSINDGLCHCQ